MKKAIFNWSGGKDSALALYKILSEKGIEVSYLLTSLNEKYKRISAHGVRESLLDKQAKSIGIPLIKIMLPDEVSNQEYENLMNECWVEKKKEGIEYCISGDIFLEDIKEYREKQLSKLEIKCLLPLWKIDSKKIVEEFNDLGFRSIVVCVNDKYLDESFVGRMIDKSFLDDLPENVDPCGENGEFHSFVFDGPIFEKPIDFIIGEKKYIYKEYKEHDYKGGFWFCELIDE